MVSIAIDGPASSGKSSVAKRLASRLGYLYLDTGAMYRCVTLYALEHQVNINDEDTLKECLKGMNIQFVSGNQGQHVYLNGRDVTGEIRSDRVNAQVSEFSALAFVREAMVQKQREIAQKSAGIVMDGRDIGTVVLPDAEVKIFLTASPEERARRRYLQNQEKGLSGNSYQEILDMIRHRDQLDSQRSLAPLKQADDAVRIDSSNMNLDQVEEKIMDIIRNKVG